MFFNNNLRIIKVKSLIFIEFEEWLLGLRYIFIYDDSDDNDKLYL